MVYYCRVVILCQEILRKAVFFFNFFAFFIGKVSIACVVVGEGTARIEWKNPSLISSRQYRMRRHFVAVGGLNFSEHRAACRTIIIFGRGKKSGHVTV